LVLPQRTRLIFVRHFRIGAGCLHVNPRFATSPGRVTAYDFDPTTPAKNSAKTPSNEKGGYQPSPLKLCVFWEGFDVVGADSGRAEIVWWL
jgi:hypothetical protein